MKDFKVKITETYTYEIDVKADSQAKALKQAKEYYENANDGYVGVADGTTFEKVQFKISNKN